MANFLGPHILLGLIALIPMEAWMTHVVACAAAGQWVLLLLGAYCFPLALIHGVSIWIGALL